MNEIFGRPAFWIGLIIGVVEALVCLHFVRVVVTYIGPPQTTRGVAPAALLSAAAVVCSRIGSIATSHHHGLDPGRATRRVAVHDGPRDSRCRAEARRRSTGGGLAGEPQHSTGKERQRAGWRIVGQ